MARLCTPHGAISIARRLVSQGDVALKELAAREGITSRFAQHIWSVLNKPSLGYPSSEVVARWQQVAGSRHGQQGKRSDVRAECEEIQKFLVTWPSWLFARGDLAAGGAGDERPLEFSDASLKVEAKHRFAFFRGGRGGSGGPRYARGTARDLPECGHGQSQSAIQAGDDLAESDDSVPQEVLARPGPDCRATRPQDSLRANPQPESRPMRGGENLPRLPLKSSCHRGIREEAWLREKPGRQRHGSG